ncbi:hypothetical protein HB943_16435, partial [Listeria weihenstephanensis]
MGETYEYPESSSGGSHQNGADLQLASDEVPVRYDYLGTDKIYAIIKGTELLKASHEDIQSFFLSHDSVDEKVDYLKKIFNEGLTEFDIDIPFERGVVRKILNGNFVEIDEVDKTITAGYKIDDSKVHFWEGSYHSRTAEVYHSWENLVDYVDGMILLDELVDTDTQEVSQFTLFGEAEIQVEPFVFKQKVIDAILKSERVSQKGKIYDQLNKGESNKQNIAFIKNLYGTGGSAPVVIGTRLSDHTSPQGYEIWLMGTDKRVSLKWQEVLKMVSRLMQTNQYLTQEEKQEWNIEKAELGSQPNSAFSAIQNEDEDEMDEDEITDDVHSERNIFPYALTKPALSEAEVNALLKTTDLLQATKKEIFDFFKKSNSDLEKEKYISAVFNDQFTEIYVGKDNDRYGYKTYEDG